MGRLHSNGKGISASALPYSRTPPAWLKTTPEQVVDQICKLAKKGATPSQIGVVLRDSHGIAQVKVVTGMSKWICALRCCVVRYANLLLGNKILRILKSNGMTILHNILLGNHDRCSMQQITASARSLD
jgi:small subunit ribosomal protein S13e